MSTRVITLSTTVKHSTPESRPAGAQIAPTALHECHLDPVRHAPQVGATLFDDPVSKFFSVTVTSFGFVSSSRGRARTPDVITEETLSCKHD